MSTFNIANSISSMPRPTGPQIPSQLASHSFDSSHRNTRGTDNEAVESKRSTITNKATLLLSAHTWIPQIAQILCVITSFGVIFPPLAILGWIVIVTKTYILQFMTWRFMAELETSNSQKRCNVGKYWKMLESESRLMVELVRDCLRWSFPIGSIVLAFFLFDMIGGIYPGQQEQYASILPCVFLGAVGLFYFIKMIILASQQRKLNSSSSQITRGEVNLP